MSISHSGSRVVLAVSAAGPVGVDVESLDKSFGQRIDDHVLSPAERERHAGDPEMPVPDLLAYWTRKEALLKVTGDGLRVSMVKLTVSPPEQPPRLVERLDRPELVDRTTMRTIDPGPGHVGCLALIDQPDAVVRERRATEIFSG